ncbi:MAG: serine/threonine protein kinase, partial [Planctomycetes bacterium]|nr:serine/threonine protein kinase [Planctomycetota bacterium]
MTLEDGAVRRFRDFLGQSVPEPPPEGMWLGKYLLKREVARGGMGIVFEAEDPKLKRRVAVKVLKETEAGAEEVARLHREAAIAAQLRHPNIVPIHEVGMVRDDADRCTHYIAMDFVDGRTFAAVVRDPAVARGERLRMLEDVARAVAFAHSKGVVHRDLKPENVLVDTTGRVALTDFGLARSESFQTRLTASFTVMGTPAYMAPEQVKGLLPEVDARTDVYALGVMLYEALVGKPPFQADVPATLYDHILHREPARPTELDPSIERDVEVVCL